MNEVNCTSILIGMHLISDIDLGTAGWVFPPVVR